MIIKDNMANMCAKITSTYMEFTLAFGPKPEFSFSFKWKFTKRDCREDENDTASGCGTYHSDSRSDQKRNEKYGW